MSVNIGFIGVGGIAGVHLKNLDKINDANIAAVYDVNAERVNEVAKQYNAAAYTDQNEMLDKANLDAVYICIPPFAHGDAEDAVIERGLPMLVEKPISIEKQPAEQILEKIEKKNLLTQVGYHWRYSDASNWAKQALSERTTGMVNGYWLGGMPMAPWWRKMDGSGGQMLEQTTHIVDLARYLVGEITEVYAVYGDRGMKEIVEGVTVPDVGSVTLKFENSAVGTISNTCLLDQGYTVGLNVLTRDSVLEIRSDTLTERKNGEVHTRKNKTEPFYEEDAAFVQAVQTNDQTLLRSNYQDAYKTHLVTVAANDSAASGQPIQLG